MITTTYLRRLNAKLLFRTISTVDQREVNKFSEIGSQWWNPNSLYGAGPLHTMNPCRVGYIRSSMVSYYKYSQDEKASFSSSISSSSSPSSASSSQPSSLPLQGFKLLDIGCGGGLLSEALSRLGGEVTGIDPSAASIAVAKEHSSHDPATATINYKSSTIEELSQDPDILYDAICCLEVIEHVDQPLMFLQHCAKLLKPNGSLFLSTINRTPKSFGVAIVGAEYITSIIPRGTHDWRKFITPDELDTLVKAASPGMELISKKGMVLDVPLKEVLSRPISVAMSPMRYMKWKLSEDDLDINYIMHFAKV